MDADTVAKMLDTTYPRKAVWRMVVGSLEMDVVGTVLAAAPDSFRVQTEHGDPYTLATSDVLTLMFV